MSQIGSRTMSWIFGQIRLDEDSGYDLDSWSDKESNSLSKYDLDSWSDKE
jgi:hypothetical protein